MNVLLFAGDDYYPLGGARDLQGKFSTVEQAKAAHDPDKFTYDGGWANILDLDNAKIYYWGQGVWYDDFEAYELSL